jgi:hypothetical protein
MANGGQALPQELDAVHPGLGAASAVTAFGATVEPVALTGSTSPISLVVNSAARISSVRWGNGPLDRFLIRLTLVDPDVDLAPDPALRATVLAGVPLPFALDLDPGAVDQEVQRAVRTAVGNVHLQRSTGLRGATGATVPSHSGVATTC